MATLLCAAIACATWAVGWGAIGHLLGARNGRGLEGAVAAALLGPFGLLVALFLPAAPSCPFCGGAVVSRAVRCRHCGKALP